MANRQQISGRGVAQEKGLEVFRTITTFTGQYLNWGDTEAYGTSLDSDADYTVDNSAADPHLDVLVNAPPTEVGQWMRYHTDSGSNYAAATAPTSSAGRFIFNGQYQSSNFSYSGIYQMMLLEEGESYEIQLLTPTDRDWETAH